MQRAAWIFPTLHLSFTENNKWVSMAKKCHNHTLQTKPWHRKEETQNTNCHMPSKAN